MAEQLAAIQGLNKFLMFRPLKDAGKEVGKKLSLQTSHELSYEASSDAVATKDGIIQTIAPVETTLTMDALASTDPLYADLKKALFDHDLMEVWEVTYDVNNTDGEHEALYLQAFVTTLGGTNDVDGASESSVEFAVNGIPQEGKVKFDKATEEAFQYAFRNTDIVKDAPEA